MKFKNMFPIAAMLLIGLMAGCEKEQAPISPDGTSPIEKAKKDPGGLVLKAVNLGIAGNFVILSQSGITDVYPSDITGDVGSSPISGSAILLKCDEVTGTIYSVDAAGPLPCRVTNANKLTTAVKNMHTAYIDAAGRAPTSAETINVGGGEIGGKTLKPGVYKWGTGVTISTDVTLSGNSKAIWIFQIAETLTMASDVKIILTGGALAKNIFWQVAGAVTLGTYSHFEGVILGFTNIAMQTGATMNGRLLAQTAVTLDTNTVVQPR